MMKPIKVENTTPAKMSFVVAPLVLIAMGASIKPTDDQVRPVTRSANTVSAPAVRTDAAVFSNASVQVCYDAKRQGIYYINVRQTAKPVSNNLGSTNCDVYYVEPTREEAFKAPALTTAKP